ncbi:MAG: type VI secretion system baseplate subunit TssK, partial [Bryobacteraceae bacterium]
MNNFRRVVWTRGMFLTPQHFQTQDRYFDQILQFRFANSLYANWGVVTLEIDETALRNGNFVLAACSGVLRDSLAFELNGDEAPAGRPVEEAYSQSKGTLDVFLAIPEERPRGKNITHIDPKATSPGIAPTRYIAENQKVVDENNTDEEKIVEVGRQNFRILFGNESLEGSSAIRIAQVQRPKKDFVLHSEFVPACLDFSVSDYLTNLVSKQIEVLRNRSAVLAAQRAEKGQGQAAFTTMDVAVYW